MRQNRLPTQKLQRAFTLIELMVTISVLGVILAIALPNLRDFVVGNRLSSNVNAFVGMLSYARSEAIVRNKQVTVCPKDNATNACVSDREWGQYETQIFVDEDGSDDWSTGDTLLKTYAAVDAARTEFVFRRQNTTGPNDVSFQSGGSGNSAPRFDINAIKTGDTAYEIRYGRTVCISRPGRARVLGSSNVCPAN